VIEEPAIGDLDRRITIRQWVDMPNAAFGLDQTFDAGVTVWAKVEPVHGLANRAAAQTGEAPTDFFWVRASTGTRAQDLTAAHVVEWAGRRYRIIDAIAVGQMRRFTRISAKDLGAI
jgi:head-tail adaptor